MLREKERMLEAARQMDDLRRATVNGQGVVVIL